MLRAAAFAARLQSSPPACTAGAALPQGFQAQALVKLLGCGLGAGAAASFGLKQLADSSQLASPTAQRLQLGLMGFSAGWHQEVWSLCVAAQCAVACRAYAMAVHGAEWHGGMLMGPGCRQQDCLG